MAQLPKIILHLFTCKIENLKKNNKLADEKVSLMIEKLD
jgi:hypothetical protein